VPKYFESPSYGGSYKGLNTETPAIYLDPSESPAVTNMWFRNRELRSRPTFPQVFLGPEQQNRPLGQTSFTDTNNTIHTCSFTSRGLWQLNPFNGIPSRSPWSYIGGGILNAGTPVASRAFAGLLYYTNGVPYLQSWDGISSAPVIVSSLTNAAYGGTGSSVGGVFLFEINFQLCLLNVTLYNAAAISGGAPAGSVTNYPNRIWYSANGIPNVWDPTVNTSAGFVDFPDVPDQFTGAMAIGEIAYLFRSNGITQMTIAGNSLAPYYFDHLWASEHGIGNVYPFSIAQYGSIGMFISTEQIYKLSINSFEEIGGGARDNIMRDLAAASSPPVSGILANHGKGFIYLTYHLLIPMATFTRDYMYSIEDKNWTVNEFPGIIVTGPPTTVWR
jgi:hypothetical protein